MLVPEITRATAATDSIGQRCSLPSRSNITADSDLLRLKS